MNEPHRIEGLYVHVPFCDGKCGYCGFYSVPYEAGLAHRWLDAVHGEKALIERQYGRLKPDTVYFGGGTPTLLSTQELDRLAELVAGWGGTEWTIEANPGSVDVTKLDALRAAGVNRISLGVQAVSDSVLRFLGRRHTVADTRAAVSAVCEAGFDNWGIDLIACVPGVSVNAWEATVRVALDMAPRHVSVYALTREEGSALARRLDSGDIRLLDEDEQLAMLEVAERTLCVAGYERYEISNYALPGFACRHNLACWRGRDYIGLGCAASSRVGALRWTNRADVGAYVAALHAGRRPPLDQDPLSPVTDATERLIFGLRLAEGIDVAAVVAGARLGESAAGEHWRRTLATLREKGLATVDGSRWRLTPRGRDLADHVAVELTM
jgi:oxygen-independent coproporphyrinogen-3 oxidase